MSKYIVRELVIKTLPKSVNVVNLAIKVLPLTNFVIFLTMHYMT
jgi:hypothetical protein